MSKSSVLVLSILLAAGLFLSIFALTAASGDSTALLPGITGKDDRPNGCVDCHVKTDKEDMRLNTIVGEIKGHPNVSKIVKRIPDNCEMCHKGTGKAPALANVLHKGHFKDEHFVPDFKGQCLSCHQLVQATGEVKVKSGQANW